MYKRVETEMSLAAITEEELAKITGISYNALILKLKGECDITLAEAFKIQEALKTPLNVKILFGYDKKNRPA